mmetsp:Transcript_135447/g.377261  ORF Transcript_135447/g.377261 Transcript_135447/m.377261 type:complete len:238 (-) Transcript_135447:166-879(-)|eukprot:CAMPEP_0179106400 /NCGR_PEP_ID=MMETSP0796-20121207/49470_1 /TAXON_ID=73915 /ORGANISM="Pyrodinium bahamense, Strain pbaha01" /LENGTH=237 /DNA_ID=CAMNT_0020804429 /DNA_START=49 /DNA_END=762 /DNA_ORIENTATION=-
MADKLVSVTSSAETVRKHLAEQAELNNDESKPLRHVDPETGALTLYSSADALVQWLPKMGWEHVTAWSKMPVFRVLLFHDRAAFLEGGMLRSYVEHVFPDGEDLLAALLWWRKRVREEGKGFAIFEGGFDTTGLVHLTDAPRVLVDAATGEVDADDEEAIQKKRELHEKRRRLEERWAAKGVPEEVRARIQNAEHLISAKKQQGQEYMMKGGWVPKETAKEMDIAAHNVRCKTFEAK